MRVMMTTKTTAFRMAPSSLSAVESVGDSRYTKLAAVRMVVVAAAAEEGL